MTNTAFIIPLAYPDTVVRVSNEWYVQHLHYLGVGKKNYVKAGHAALLLIEKETGIIEYFDFGRYITPQPFGRVRSAITDHELIINFKAEVSSDEILNLDKILKFFATNPKLTHGEGRMVASVCAEVNYAKAKSYIAQIQSDYLVPYAAFKKKASNCARFVTDTLLNSIENSSIEKKLKRIQFFTPSPVGNVLAVKGTFKAFQVTEKGQITEFKTKKHKEILSSFLDRVKTHEVNLKGNLEPVRLAGLSKNAQWLSGIGAGAWFELFNTEIENEYLFKRTSAFGTVDVEAVFRVDNSGFNALNPYVFNYRSHCNEIIIEQNKIFFTFEKATSLLQKEHSA